MRCNDGIRSDLQKPYRMYFLQKKFLINDFETRIIISFQVLNEVLSASEIANKIKEEALTVKNRAENLVNIISVDQREAEGKLLAAKPALDAAEAALLVLIL